MKGIKSVLIPSTLLIAGALSSCSLRINSSLGSASSNGAASSNAQVSSEAGSASTSSSSENASSAAPSSSSAAASSSSAASSINASSEASEDYVPAGYSLKWSDEFSGTALDSSSWSAQVGDGSDYGITGWGNGEAEDYTADNATVSAGVLHITAVKESTTYNNTNYQYTSARLRTSGKVFKTYGYIEAKIKLPAVKGLWPAFWMLPESNYENRGWPTSGEIDIMENKGRETYKVGGTTHSANSNYGDAYHTGSTTLASSIENWHIYGVEWTDEAIAFSVDGVVYNTVSRDTWVNDCALYEGGPAPFNKPFHLILNLAVGGQYDGYTLPPSSFSSAEMLVDYVRIYQA